MGRRRREEGEEVPPGKCERIKQYPMLTQRPEASAEGPGLK